MVDRKNGFACMRGLANWSQRQRLLTCNARRKLEWTPNPPGAHETALRPDSGEQKIRDATQDAYSRVQPAGGDSKRDVAQRR